MENVSFSGSCSFQSKLILLVEAIFLLVKTFPVMKTLPVMEAIPFSGSCPLLVETSVRLLKMANLLCIHIPGEVFQSSEGYLELSRASGIKRFLEKIAGGFFLQKSSIIDLRLGSQYASGVVLLYSICVIGIQHNHQNFLQKECSFQ